mgnify:CR=1 FL=1
MNFVRSGPRYLFFKVKAPELFCQKLFEIFADGEHLAQLKYERQNPPKFKTKAKVYPIIK